MMIFIRKGVIYDVYVYQHYYILSVQYELNCYDKHTHKKKKMQMFISEKSNKKKNRLQKKKEERKKEGEEKRKEKCKNSKQIFLHFLSIALLIE